MKNILWRDGKYQQRNKKPNSNDIIFFHFQARKGKQNQDYLIVKLKLPSSLNCYGTKALHEVVS
jgi:hypothetical protein